MKTALLVVSFGTTHLDALEQTIAQTEKELRLAFPDFPFYRAFTSKMVRTRLKSMYGMEIDSVEAALARIAADGCEQVLLQPTLVIPGKEADEIAASVQCCAGKLNIAMGKPLLHDESDMEDLIAILKEAYPVSQDTALLLMGHGSDHGASKLYEQFNQKMRQDREMVMRLCTMKGSPSFADGVAELSSLPQRKVILAPLLLVAGAHVKKDMAGQEPDSLCRMLAASGFTVTPVLQGLGRLEAIRQGFVERAKAAARSLE